MATVKKAVPAKKVAKKAAPAAKKAAPAKKSAKEAKAAKSPKGEKTQKEIVVEAASKGMNVDQIVAKFGLKKSNVAWYFSRLNLRNNPTKKKGSPIMPSKTTAKKIVPKKTRKAQIDLM